VNFLEIFELKILRCSLVVLRWHDVLGTCLGFCLHEHPQFLHLKKMVKIPIWELKFKFLGQALSFWSRSLRGHRHYVLGKKHTKLCHLHFIWSSFGIFFLGTACSRNFLGAEVPRATAKLLRLLGSSWGSEVFIWVVFLLPLNLLAF